MRLAKCLTAALSCVIALGALIPVAGCSSAEGDKIGDEQQVVQDAPTEQAESEGSIEIFYGARYSEGLAFVELRTTNSDGYEDTYACIDDDGVVKFSFDINQPDNKLYAMAPFEDGYSYLYPAVGYTEEGYESLGIVDSDGNVTLFGDEEGVLIVAHGGGYVILERHEEGFDSNAYSYEIRDATGELVETLNPDNPSRYVKARYCGQGVFQINFEDAGGFYCCKTKKLVQEGTWEDVDFVGDSDTALFYIDGEEVAFLTSSGDIKYQKIPESLGRIHAAKVNDGLCVLNNGSGLYLLDVSSGELKTLPEEYAKRVDFEYLDSCPATFHDGRCVLQVIGDDNEHYFQVFDTDWNLVFGPVQGHLSDEEVYSDGILTEGNVVYDTDGNVLFETESNILSAGDGVLINAESLNADGWFIGFGDVTYLDQSGDPLFAEVTYNENSKVIKLDEWNLSQGV